MNSFEVTKAIGMLIYRELSVNCEGFAERVMTFGLSSNYLRSCINDDKLWCLFDNLREKTNELLHHKFMCAVLCVLKPEKKSELLMRNKEFLRMEKKIRHCLKKIKKAISDEEMQYYYEYEKDYNELVSFIEDSLGRFLNVYINSVYKNWLYNKSWGVQQIELEKIFKEK